MELRKATRQRVKLRVGMAGVAGSGKTLSALLLASGMTTWDKIALIDTENGSGELYAKSEIAGHKIGEYNYLRLSAPYTPEKYIEALEECAESGMEVIVMDSITHEWDGEGGLLEVHSKMLGNSFTNWAKITPRHNKFIQAILQSPCHVITTVRKKQDYDMAQGNDGKTKVVKVGLKEIQREGFEYELTLNFEIDIAHQATAGKDRTGLFMDKPGFEIKPEIGTTLREWCESGSEPIKEEVIAMEPASASTAAKPSHAHLLSLQNELKKRGATDVASALVILNDGLADPYTDLNLSEEDASYELVRLLQKKMPEEKPDSLPGLPTHPAILKEAAKKSKKSSK